MGRFALSPWPLRLGHVGRLCVPSDFDGLRQTFAKPGCSKASWDRAHAFQPVGRVGGMRGNLQKCLVLEDPVPWHVARLRFDFSPLRERGDHREKALARGSRFQPLPGLLWIQLIEGGSLQRFDLFLYPGHASGAFETLRKSLKYGPQVRDISQRVFKLSFRERATTPVGESCRLVDLGMRQLSRQSFVGGGIAEAADHRGDLAVE